MNQQRRTRHKVTELGVDELVSELLARGVTYEEISRRLAHEQGIDVSKSSIARYNDSVQRRVARIRETRHAAEALAKVIQQETGTEADTQMTDLLLAALQHQLLNHLGEETSIKETAALSFAGAQVAKAKAHLEKVKETERTRARKAWEHVIAESRALLIDSGLWEQVEKVLRKGMAQSLQESKP